jgi:hypothetical protein
MSDSCICLLVAGDSEEVVRMRAGVRIFGHGQAQDLRAGRDGALTEKRDPLDGRVVLVRPGADLLVGLPEGVVVPDDPLAHAVVHDPHVLARIETG